MVFIEELISTENEFKETHARLKPIQIIIKHVDKMSMGGTHTKKKLTIMEQSTGKQYEVKAVTSNFIKVEDHGGGMH